MVDWRYRGVPAFVCMNAVYGSVIRLTGDCHRANSVTTAPKRCHTNIVEAPKLRRKH